MTRNAPVSSIIVHHNLTIHIYIKQKCLCLSVYLSVMFGKGGGRGQEGGGQWGGDFYAEGDGEDRQEGRVALGGGFLLWNTWVDILLPSNAGSPL